MTQPLVLVCYENLLPGTQLVNRLQDLNYRLHVLNNPERLAETAEQIRPLLVFVDLTSARADVGTMIAALRGNPATAHVPVVAFGGDDAEHQAAARRAGATLVVASSAMLSQLPQILEQALEVD